MVSYSDLAYSYNEVSGSTVFQYRLSHCVASLIVIFPIAVAAAAAAKSWESFPASGPLTV